MNYKHFALVICAALVYTYTFAQPRIKDQGVIGGDNEDVFSSMYLTKDGGLIVGGYSFSSMSAQKSEDSRGGYDYWIVKLDSNHKVQWDKTIGSNTSDYLSAIQQTTDGGYLLGGYSYADKSGEKTENSRGGDDYWIVKLDEAGNIQWDKTIGGSSYDYLYAVQQTTDGGYILGGYSWSDKSADKTEDSRGITDYWIVKLDSNLNIQWDKTIGGSDADEITALQQTADGGYIVGGSSLSNKSGEKTEDRRGNYDYWIVKLDNVGNIQWDRTIGGSKFEDLYAVQQTRDGGYILGGISISKKSGEKTETSRGSIDMWIVKLDTSGNIQWDKTIGGSDYDDLLAVQQTIDGGYILGGNSASNISGEKTENSRGWYDYWIVKTNSKGKVQWDKTIGGDGYEGYTKVLEIKRNDYAIGGGSHSGVSGDKTGGNRGPSATADYWLVELKYVKPESTAIAQVQNNIKLNTPLQNNDVFTIYPNPAYNQITIQTKGKASFILTNQAGKILISKTITNNGIIDVGHLSAGVYLLTNTATGRSQKLVIAR